ncbi:ESPR-type extended signal peptide-containing protein [Acinetobacter sp. Ac_3412]|uniref:ESPR-type extended signal peptide-containing protein n=1 Tax=Acinetobacter sp. Ac_3412 TaxID=1848935 RepID=UPI00148FD9C3|nr:ESPR-type extended signal peptide-containing protein [Acinetobacter sp. Ac_3412]
MNKIYRLVWNKSLNLWTVVSENARGVTKKRNVAANISIKTAASLSNPQDQHVLFKPSLIAIALSSVFFSTGAFAAANIGGGVSSNGSSMAISPPNDQCSGMGGQASITNGTTGNGGGSVAMGCGNNISGTDSTWQQRVVNRRGAGDVAYGAGVPTGNTGGVLTGSTAVGRQNMIRGIGGATVVGTANNSNSSSNFHNVLIGQGNSSGGTGGYNTLMGVGNQVVDAANATSDGTGVGTNSIAIGIANRVTGQTAIAFGRQSYADADYSIAQGNTATVNKGATGGIALGYSATTSGARGIAIGSSDSASRDYDLASSPHAAGVDSIAMGTRSKATGNETVAVGRQSTAGNARDIAIGQGATAQGVTDNGVIRTAVAVGSGSRAAGRNTVALGEASTASGSGATATGAGAQATGDFSTSTGNQSKATANFTTATGNQAAALAEGATVTGSNATAGGILSSAFGAASNASGEQSVAVGAAAESAGENAVAVGPDAKANSANDIAIGNDAATALGSNGNNIAMGNGVTTGATGQNISIGSDGTTANSETAEGGAVAIGRNQIASGDGAVAIGDPNRAMGSGAVALGKDNTAAGDNTASTMANGAVAIGNTNLAVGQGSVALGNTSTAAAAGAIALGDTANAQATRGVAMGSNAVATNVNDVALGSGSVTSAANPTSNGTVGDITYNYAGTSPSSVMSVGSEGNERQITNVAAGRVNETSTDAINGSQLYSTQKALGNLTESTANHLGGNSVVNPDGSITAPSYIVNETPINNVGDAIEALDQGWNLQSNGAGADAIKAGDTVDIGTVTGEENLTVTKNGNTIQYGLNKVLKVDSVTAGDTVINDNGVTIANGPSITKSGINAAGNPISNVGAGVAGTDAVNKDQLDDAAAAAKTEVTQGKNITVSKTTGADGQDIYNVATADNVDFNNVTVGGANGVNIDGTTGKISGVTAGEVSATSDEAINGSQLAGTAKSVSDALGGGSTVNPDGTVTAPSYTVNGETVRNVGDAITELDKGWNLQSNGANAGAIKAGDTVDIGTVAGEENLTVTKNGNTIQYGLNKDLKVDSVTAGDTVINTDGVTISNGPSITKSGINVAGNPISNVGAGVNDTDAVNKGQLDDAAAAAKTEVTQGKNITVTKTKGLDGQDIYNVATADNVDFNNVTVGDVTIDGSTGKISGVTAGEVSATSDEAINGSQLAGTAKSVSDALGGGSTVNPDGTVSAPSYTVNGVESNNVGAAISELDKGWNLQSNGANGAAIKAGDTVDIGTVAGEENLTVTKNGNTIQYGLNKDLKVDSVTAGDTVINTDGVTISNGPSITKSGINAAGNPISNVGAGVNDSDAVNKGQLDDAAAAAKTEVTQGKNITVSKTTGADGQDIYNVATADNVDFNNVTVGGANGVNIDGATGKISGVTAGEVSATSDEAINGSQLAGTAKSVSDALGGGSTVNPDGTVTAPSYTVNGETVRNVGDAITELDKGWNLQSNGANAGAIKAGDTVDIGTVAGEENLTVTKNGNTIQYGLNKDLKVDSVTAGDTVINTDGVTISNGPSITKSGINVAGNPITNVGAGVNDTDAVNKGQLDDAAAAAKTEVTQGKNITVTKTTGSDGQDIYNVATADNVDFNNVTVGGANGVNIDGTTGKISGVTAGEVSATSDEAINGSQLAGTAKSVSDALGGGSTVNPDGTVTAPSYTVNGVESNNVGAAISELDKGWNLQSNGANAGAVKAGDTVDIGTVTGEENLTVTKNGNTIQYGLNKDLKVDSVTAGDTVINTNGVTITNGPSITKSGINAAGNPISNVGAGVNDTDAVNKSQLDKAAAAAKTEVEAGKNMTVESRTGTDGQTIYEVATADDVDFNNVTVGGPNGVNIDGTTGKISGVTDGTVAAGSKDAVNGGQLNDSVASTGDILGGGVTNEGGRLNGPFTVNDKGYDTVADAIQGEAAAAKTEVEAGKNMTVESRTGADGQTIYEVATADNVDFNNVTVGGPNGVNIDGTTGKISGVTDGTVAAGSKDAVNGGQLNDSVASTGDILGGGVTNEGGKLNGPFTVNDKGYDTVADAIQGEAAAAKTEVTEGKNVTVTKTTGADGQDIYNVATKDDVSFDSVQVGDVNIDGTTGKISGVTDGTIAAGSKDAVNGGQLHGVADSVRNSIGGETTLNPDGSITTANVGNTGQNNIHDAIDSVRGQAVAAKTEVEAGKNMTVESRTGADGQTIYEVATADDVSFDSVQVGDVNIDGATGKISGVADGTIAAGSKDAINGGQLNDSLTSTGDILGGGVTNEGGKLNGPFTVSGKGYDTVADAIQGEAAAAKTEVTEGKNVTVTKTTGADGQDIYNVATKDDVSFDSVQVGDVNIDGTTGKISGVADGTIAAGSKDAVNGGQIHGIADSVKNSIGGETTLNPDGSITTGNVGNTGQNNIHDAIDSVRGQAVAAKTTVTEGDNMVVTQTKNADGSTNYEVATARDVDFDSVQVGDVNIDAATGKISGVADGTIAAGSKDAVNGGQLNDSIASTGDILGGGVTNEGGKLNGPFTVSGKGYDTVADAIQGEAAASKTEVTEGKNVTVTKTTGADGQDIYNVATKDDVSFDSVQVGDVNIDAATGKISGVADGTIAAGSKDAINGGQLNDSIASTGDILGGGVTNEGGKLNGPFTVSGKGYDTVADAIQGEAAAAKTEVTEGKNVTVTKTTGADGQDIYNVATKDDVSFDSVQVGDVNIDGTTGKISGVADGTIAAGSTEAINGGQIHGIADSVKNSIGGETTLNPDGSITTGNVGNTGQNNIHDAIDSVRGQAVAAKTTVTEGDNMVVTQSTNPDGSTNYEVATARDVDFDSVQVGDVNIDGATGKISGVADGTIAAGSKDAVNGGQLNDSVASTGDILGGGVTNEGGKLNGPFTVSGKGYDTVADAIQGEAAASKTEVTEGKNVTVTKTTGGDGQDIYNVATKDDVDFNNVTVGGPNGINIDGTTGKISGVADGTVAAGSKDAVNGGQLDDSVASTGDILGGGVTNEGGKLNGPFTVSGKGYDTVADAIQGEAAAAKTEVTEGKNVTVTKTTGADGQDIYNVATKDDVDFDSVQVGDVSIDGTTGKISGVADGTIAAGSKDAVNGGQLNDSVASTGDILGGGVTNEGSKLNGPFTVNDKGYDTVADAIQGEAAAAKTEVEAGKNMTVENRTGTDGQTIYEVATADDVSFDSVQVGDVNIDGTTGKISGIADGTIAVGSKDAVNGGQLNDSIASTGDILGGGVTNEGGKLNGPFTVSGKGYDTVADAIQGEAAASKTEVTEGKNVTVTKTTGADGQDIYNVATKDDVSFDSVQVGDVNIDGATGKISGVADGTIAAGSKDAINGGQIHAIADSVKNSIGGETTLNPDGSITTGNVGNTGQNNIHDAIDSVRGQAVAAKTTVTEGDNMVVTQSKNADGSTNYEVATAKDVKFDSVTATDADGNETILDAKGVSLKDQAGNTTILGQDGLGFADLMGNSVGPRISARGIDAGNTVITGVAPGRIAADSTDAINGSQLKGVADSVSNAIGGNTTVNPDGSINTSNIGGTGKDNINDAIGAVGKAAQAAKTTVSKADGDENITVTSRPNDEGGTDFQVGLSKDIKVDSVTAGDTVINGDGLIIAGGPSVTKDGIDAGDNKVTGVADGTVAAGSKDAINGSQLHGVADSVKNVVGGNAKVNPDGSMTTSNVGGTGKNNIDDAINSVRGAAAAAKSTVSNKDGNISVNETTKADGSKDFEVGLAKDIQVDSVTAANQVNVGGAGETTIAADGVRIAEGPSITKGGIDAGSRKVTAVAEGAITPDSKDAINGSQLHQSYENVAKALGGGAGYDPSAGWTAPSYEVAGGKHDNVGDALNALNNADQALGDRITNLGDQMQQAFYDTNQRIDDVKKMANAGVAAAMALETAPYISGKYTYAVGAAYHGGENAVGLTLRKTADNGRWSLTTGVAAASQGDPSFRVGLSGVFD